MICKKCGKKIERNVDVCSGCGKIYNLELLSKTKVNLKVVMAENGYKIAMAIISIIIFFLPWIRVMEMPANFFKINSMISEIVDEIIVWTGFTGMSDELYLLFFIKGICYIEVFFILLNIGYIALVIFDKERYWMMGMLILLQVIYCVGIMFIVLFGESMFAQSFDGLKLSIGPIVMIVVLAVLGEIAASKEVDFREKMYPNIVS